MVTQITADELADRLDTEESIQLIDTRPEDSFTAWHIAGATNVPYNPREEPDDDDWQRVRERTDNGSLTVICGKGLTSTPFAFELEQRGYEDVTVVKGGMEDWSKVYEVVPINTASDDLVLLQIQRRANGCLGYVVGSRTTGDAAVVDVTRQIGTYEIAAEEAGLTIEHVLDTHVHADHISGGAHLATVLDAPYYLGDTAAERDVQYTYEPLENGDVVTVGNITIEAIHAPGHTTEMVNYRISDGDGTGNDNDKYNDDTDTDTDEYLLTGDTLFVESVGRTELQFGDKKAAEGAKLLYQTLHEQILTLPDETRILPGHVSVTADGQYEYGQPGHPIEAKLGELRNRLDLLGLDEQEFVDRLSENTPAKPSHYETIIAINTGSESPDSDSEATELELGPNNCAA